MLVLGGSSSRSLAGNLATSLGAPLCRSESRRFPDDELYVRILDDVKGEDVVLVQSTYPDARLLELLLWQDAARESGAKSVTTVIPYYGYGRQDKRFLEGEPVSARALARCIQTSTDGVVAVDLHNTSILGHFDVPARHVTGMAPLGGYLKENGVEVVLAPDKGALERAKKVASIVGCEWDHLEKKRIDSNTVEMKPKSLEVKGLSVAIVDDIISTGGTVVAASGFLRASNAKRITAACTHGLFVGNALEKLKKCCDEVVSTDTIEGPSSRVSVADEVASAVRSLLK